MDRPKIEFYLRLDAITKTFSMSRKNECLKALRRIASQESDLLPGYLKYGPNDASTITHLHHILADVTMNTVEDEFAHSIHLSQELLNTSQKMESDFKMTFGNLECKRAKKLEPENHYFQHF